jgi:hypothetical protein
LILNPVLAPAQSQIVMQLAPLIALWQSHLVKLKRDQVIYVML